MKIGLDARLYGPEQGGLGRYIVELIKHLEKLDPPAEFNIFLRRDNYEQYQPQNKKFKKILADVPWYGLGEQLRLPQIFGRAKLDLLHVPHWNVPIAYRCRFVVTIHDLILLHYPTRHASALGPLSYWLKNFAFRRALNYAARHSQHILTPSNFTKQDIVKTLGVPEQKIIVTPLAPFTQTQILNQKSEILNKYKISKPYALYVGVAFPHKNLEGLLRAWKIFTDQHVANYQLVLAGKKNYFYNRLESSIFNLQSSKIIFTDFVPDADLPALYQNASAYIHPSFYEGSALPALEAMRYGVPVVASNSSCLPELLGGAALYVNPRDPDDLARGLAQIISNPALVATLQTQAALVLQLYNWEDVAKRTWEVYKNSV